MTRPADTPLAPLGQPGAGRITAYIVPHTHWDREWYRPFQAFRARLVDVIDRVLELLERDPGYRRFTLDGQAIVLEDYLALRPEHRDRIARQVRAGRLRIGPWYVLADEFLVSPEALVRNLQLGRRICRSFGPSMPVGYTPDSFGHISQLPLIVRGFDLDSIVFERGVGDEGERLRGEFRWLAADGHTDVFAVHLLGTYSAAAALGHADWQLGDPYDRDRAVSQVRAVLHGPDGEVGALPDWLRESFERLPHGIAPYATHGAVLLLNGSDHLFPEPNVPEIVADLNAGFPEADFLHADLEEFVAAARRPLEALQTYRGEFRGSRYQHVLSGVLSARLYLKQANHRAETLLERYAEPLAALAWLEGGADLGHLLGEAWRLLLQNHPHDSICGCSVDEVHDQMMVRFADVRQLAREVTSRAQAALAAPPAEGALGVFQPLPYVRRAVVTHTVELPAGHGLRLGVVDASGNALPSQTTVETVFEAGRSDRTVDRATVRFVASLPALGVAGFRLQEAPDGARQAATPADEPAAAPVRSNRAETGVTLENAGLRLEIGADGAVTLTHRPSGSRTPLRLAFEDEADAGDEYDFSPLAGDAPLVFAAPAEPPELYSEGPVEASVRLRYRASVPTRLDPERRRREGETELPIEVDLTLDAVSPLLRLRVRVDNHAEDHRLRLRIASGCRSDIVLADGHFDVLERPVKRASGDGWFQAPRGTNHQRRFVAVSDGQRGLAVLNRGLPEYEADPGEDGVELRVTLLRCVGWLSRDDLSSRPQGAGPALPTPGAQAPGPHAFDLAILPFQGAWDDSGLLEEAQAFQADPLVIGAPREQGTRSWLALPQPLELTALKRAEDRASVILRIFNPATHRVAGPLLLWDVPREAHRVNLAEVRQEALTVASASIDLAMGPKEVATLEIVPRERKGGSAP